MAAEHDYERIPAHCDDDATESPVPGPTYRIPASPPPSFESVPSSPSSSPPLTLHDTQPTPDDFCQLAGTLDVPSDDETTEQSLLRLPTHSEASRSGIASSSADHSTPVQPRDNRYDQPSTSAQNALPANSPRVFTPAIPQRNQNGRGTQANDGVFANLSAKPITGEIDDSRPPSYEQAAADSTPPYWETTILSPGTFPDEVFIDRMPVGSHFSFIWSALISVSFQIIGFLLTYLLHTTHAAKNGSRAGLGITLIQYGFTMKSTDQNHDRSDDNGGGGGGGFGTSLSRSFLPNKDDLGIKIAGASTAQSQPQSSSAIMITPSPAETAAIAILGTPDNQTTLAGIPLKDWFAYVLMIVGWLILIASVSDYLKAKRHEQLVLQSPERDRGVQPVVAAEEPPQRVV